MPILNVSVKDVNSTTIALTGDDSVLVKYHSNALATMDLQYGAINLDTCVIDNAESEAEFEKADGEYERAYETSHTFNNVEKKVFRFACADENNQSYKKIISAPMVDYVKLTCNVLPSSIDGAGNVRVSCYGSAFFGSFGDVENEIVAECRIKKSTGAYGDWHTMDVSELTETSYLASVNLTVSDYTGQYIAEIVVSDKLETVTKTERKASKPIFHWGASDFKFEVPVTAPSMQVYDELRLKKSNRNYGSYLKFGDDDYCYIAEESDDSLVIYASNDIDLKTENGNVYINDSLISNESGEWEPVLDDEIINSYTEQRGWYSKVGETVNIGFYIKAYCASGGEDWLVAIRGLPFTPVLEAAGGGMCSGAYIAGGYNFQCFVAETDGTITTRVQQCNNTSDSNLSTSASGCYYRKSGGTITLSGTITYLTDE